MACPKQDNPHVQMILLGKPKALSHLIELCKAQTALSRLKLCAQKLMETHSESPFYTRVAAAHMRRGQTVKYPRRVEYSLFIQSIPSARARALRRIRGRARFIFAAIKITRRSVFSVRLNMVLVKFFSGYIV